MTRLALLLLGTAGALLLVLWAEFASLASPPLAAVPPRPVSGPTLKQPPPPGPDAASLGASILARPLFDPRRRPAAESQATVAAMPRVAGILVTAADRVAILAVPGTAVPLVVREGSQVEGLVVQAIAPGTIILSGPDGAVRLHPSFADTPQPAVPASLPVPPSIDED